MADKPTEKPETVSPVADAQEATAAADTKPADLAPAEETTKEDRDDTKITEETKESDKTEEPVETKDVTEEPKGDEEKPAADGDDAEMKDATDAPAAEETAEGSAAPAEEQPAASTETPASKNNKNRRKSTGEPKGKALNRKGSKARLTHLDAQPGDYFLVKLKGFPAWPATVCDESMLPHALVSSRPVTAARPDGTFTEAYADGGKRANDRSFPVMYLHTNEFGWVPNTSLTELSSSKAEESITEKMRKDLKEAYTLAVEHHPLDYYKDILKQFQEELIAQEEAKKEALATPKKSKKGKGKASDEDVDMEDADDAPEKSKSKKRKAEDDVSTPQRSDSVKKPKIKLNTSTPKASNGTPKSKDESAAKSKVKVKKTADKKAEAPKEPKMTAEQRRNRKEKEVLYLRHKLQRGLLTRDQQPQESEMKQMSEYITMLENFKDLEVSIIRTTKINKVLKAILKLETIPREEEFHFKDRSQTLLDKWNKLMSTDGAPAAATTGTADAATNGVNGKSEAKAEGDKDDSNDTKENTEEPKAEEAEKSKDEAETEAEAQSDGTPAVEKEDKEEAAAPPAPIETAA